MKLFIRIRLLILFIVAITQVFSPVLFVPRGESYGGSVFRFVIIFVGGVLAFTGGFRPVSASTRRVMIAGGLLFVWMMISLAWTIDLISGVRQISYIVSTLILVYIIDLLVMNIKDFLSFSRILLIVGVGVLIFSFYELQTGNHFFVSGIQLEAERDLSLRYVADDLAWLTFGNPNDLAVHVTFCAIISMLFFGTTKVNTALSIMFVALSVYLSDRLDARLAIIAMIVFCGIYFVTFFQRRAVVNATTAGVASLAGVSLVIFALVMIDRTEFLDVSTFIRLELVLSGVEMAGRTLLVGIGVGGFESEMWFQGLIGQTYGIVNPHNAMARMLAENGVIGFALFGFMLFGPIIALGRAGRATRLSSFVAAATTALPLLFSAGSDPLSASSLQLAIAFIWLACRFAIELGREGVAAGPAHDNSGVQQAPPRMIPHVAAMRGRG